jgi:hypothetical protein
MFLKFRYRLGYESLCAEVSDSISWRRFFRIPLDAKVPVPRQNSAQGCWAAVWLGRQVEA